MPKGGWKEYFVFSKKERAAVFILLVIIAVCVALSFFYTPVFTSPAIDKDVQSKLTALASGGKNKPANAPLDNTEDSSATASAADFPHATNIKKEPFNFDPNTLPAEGWKKLGFSDKTIENILKYRNETGKFKKPEDLYNVYRIRKKLVEAVIPFVRIGSGISFKDTSIASNHLVATVAANSKGTSYKTINVNTATADDFKVFPGMTDAVANRIIKFRNSINGFASVNDVAKTYGLPDSTFKIMLPYLTITPKQ